MKQAISKITVMFIGLIFFWMIAPGSVNAATVNSEFNNRSEEEVSQVYNELQALFPDEYHYILEYENGIDKSILFPEIIFEDTRSGSAGNYTLTVYNNGQVLLGIERDLTNSNDTASTRAYDVRHVTKSYELGDVGHFITFTVAYDVNLYAYDVIDSYRVDGDGFYLFPYNLRKKLYEDSNGNAYVGYVNSSMYSDGSGVLYDLGVIVGHDNSMGVCRLSTGVDAFITYMLNPFIWGN